MGHHSCCNKQKVKRGLWSPEEDEKLMNYISTYGHGCWSTVPRRAGLQRCGKSCRLRWINYLRPDLKRGSFSPQEASLIIELHRVLGNRWAQIAKHLPGRTDNEVKNFWNSSIKKKLVSRGLSDLASFPSPSNNCGDVPFEGFFSVNANPNLIPSAQFDRLYNIHPTTNSILQGFDNHDNIIKVDREMGIFPNLVPVPPLAVPSLIDSSCSYNPAWPVGNLQPHQDHHLDHQQHLSVSFYASRDDQLINPKLFVHSYDDQLKANGTPTFSEILKGCEFSIPSLSTTTQEVDPMGCLSSILLPPTCYPHDQILPGNRFMESIESLMTLVPSSFSSSLSSSPSSCSEIIMNPSLPSGWAP